MAISAGKYFRKNFGFFFFDLSKNCQTTHGHEVHIYFESYDLDGNRITRKRFKIESARLKGNFPRSPRRSHAVGFSSDFSLSLFWGSSCAFSRVCTRAGVPVRYLALASAHIHTHQTQAPSLPPLKFSEGASLLLLHPFLESAVTFACFFAVYAVRHIPAFWLYNRFMLYSEFKNSTEAKLFNGTISPPRCRTHCGVRAGALVRLQSCFCTRVSCD